MKHLSRTLVSLVVLPLAGCALLQPIPAAAPELALEPPKPAMVLPALGEGQAAAALDQSSAADKAEAAAVTPAASAVALGRATVALGSPAEQGFWVKSPLIKVAAKGRVVLDSGAAVNVDLLPGTGGALLSLAAFRALGLGLTDLPEVQIFAN